MKTLAAMLTLFVAATVSAADARVAELRKKADARLAAGQYTEAVSALKDALRVADSVGDAGDQIETAFTLARTHEEWGIADPANRVRHSKDALATYARLWEREPRRPDAAAAAFNNCAQIYVTLKDPERAESLFRSAIDSGGPLQSFYLANYAAFLASRGRTGDAAILYEKALKLKPDDLETEEKLLQLSDGPRVVTRLWELVGSNDLDRAQRLALDHLNRKIDADAKRELLTIVAVTLAREHMGPAEFAAVSDRLNPSAEDPAVGRGIAELRQLYAGTVFDVSAYGWWRTRGPQRNAPAIDAPLAFSALARELGEKNPQKGEAYYRLAIDVSDARDPEALVSLAELLYTQNRMDDLSNFARGYGDRIFEAKSKAYRSGDWPNIYRYHVALGTIYSRLNWVSPDANDPRSAIFQLEHAREASHKLGVVLDPRSVDYLAQNYRKVQPETGKDLALRLDVAEEYVKRGQTTSASRVLEPAAEDPRVSTAGPEKVRFDALRTLVPTKGWKGNAASTYVKPSVFDVRVLTGGVPLRRDTAVTLQKLLSDYYLTPKDQRSDAESKLRQMGVTTINDPVGEKGSVVLQQGRGAVTVSFEVVPGT